MRVVFLLLLAATLWAVDQTSQRAREILDEAAEMTDSAGLNVRILAWQRLGVAYRDFDGARSAAWLRKAFDAAALMPAVPRLAAQGRVVQSMAAVSPEAASEMLWAIPEAGRRTSAWQSAADVVVSNLVSRGIDRALGELDLMREPVAYPFAIAQVLFQLLPAEDPRRLILFDQAHAAYRRLPKGQFPEFLAQHWRDVPRERAQGALRTVIEVLPDKADQSDQPETTTADGSGARLHSQLTTELFRLAAALRELAPDSLQAAVANHPDLRFALERFPDGRISDHWWDNEIPTGAVARGHEDSDMGIPVWSVLFVSGIANRSASAEQVGTVMDVAAHRPAEALEKAGHIAHDAVRAEVFARIAMIAQGRDEKVSLRSLEAALSQLRQMRAPEQRIYGWLAVADAAHDDATAWDALQRSVSDSVALWRQEMRTDSSGETPLAYRQSTQTCRLALLSAARRFGLRAVPLLGQIDERDLALLARIDLAGALVGHRVICMVSPAFP